MLAPATSATAGRDSCFSVRLPPPPLAAPPAQELRIACTVAQQEREGGVSPRVSPLAQVTGWMHLCQRCGARHRRGRGVICALSCLAAGH